MALGIQSNYCDIEKICFDFRKIIYLLTLAKTYFDLINDIVAFLKLIVRFTNTFHKINYDFTDLLFFTKLNFYDFTNVTYCGFTKVTYDFSKVTYYDFTNFSF